jgi:hypothetical protein
VAQGAKKRRTARLQRALKLKRLPMLQQRVKNARSGAWQFASRMAQGKQSSLVKEQ